METKVDFKKIKEQLPHGAQTEIAKKANVSLNTVHMALKGKCNNIVVLNSIADYLEELKHRKNAALDRISLLID